MFLKQVVASCRKYRKLKAIKEIQPFLRSISHKAVHRKLLKSESCVSENSVEMKYILVTGGVISGVGKGVIASSFGTLLNSCGISVTSLKIDPYINIDAGTFSPYEHGKNLEIL